MPKISVIMPVHNAEKWLRRGVGSIRNQTFADYEIILVENASSDGSLALCRELAKEDRRIRVLQIPEAGPSYARNAGVDAASGEWIGFVDSDDEIEPSMYEDMLSFAETEGLDLVTCNYLKRYSHRSDRCSYVCDGSRTVCSPDEMLAMSFTEKIPQSACTLLCHRSLFDGLSFPEGRYFEDTATTWRLVRASRRCGHIATAYYIYWRHGASIVHTLDFAKAYGHALADMERLDYVNSSEVYTRQQKLEYGRWLLSFFYRYFRKMVKMAGTQEQKRICLDCREWALRLPKGIILRRKYARVAWMVSRHWKLFCLLNRGAFL